MATMSRKFPYFLAVLFIFSVIAPPIYADDQTVFGPEVFEIDEKGVHLSIQKLNVDDHGKGFIIVTKNTPDKRIKDGFIQFDKKLKKKGKLHKKGSIRLRKFLRGKKLVFEKKIKLQHANYLTIYLKGTTRASVTIEIKKADGAIPSPVVTFSADPQSITLGKPSTLIWTTTNADTVSIDQSIGNVATSGSLEVSPTETTTYTITATGLGGTTTKKVTVTVNLPPTVSMRAYPETILDGQSSTLTWSSTNADSCVIDPGVGSVDLSGSITVSPTETTIYTATVTGFAGTSTDSVTVNVYDPSAPTAVNISAAPTSIGKGGSSTLCWTSSNAISAYIDNGLGVVSVNGSTTVSPDHTTTYTITASGPTGSASAQAVVMVTGNPEAQLEGSFGEKYEDLIPLDATVESYDPKRFSLITGLVQALDESPISDVFITIHSHPEYGTANTDENGRFSIPVEGGGTMTLVYQKEGLITAQRKVYVPWNDMAIAKTIQMIAEDPASTTVTFDGNSETIVTHQSTDVTDESGSRSCTVVFKGDNKAYLVDEDGNDVHGLTTITTRATEFTTPDSMPAILPPNSAYTYCVELSADGAQRVRFDKPVIIWVDNFLGFNVGEIVPVGYYDRDRGVWVPSDNGVVLKLLDTNTDGIVDALDADGDDEPDDLNSDGSYSDEVAGLGDAQRYHPGSAFWRFAVTHFSPCDGNWPYGPPPDAIPPNPEGLPNADQQKNEGNDCHSSVEKRSRIFHEDIPIPGTDMTLHYASNRVNGYKAVITVPASGDIAPPDSLKRIVARVEAAGRILEQILDPLPNQKAQFVWDWRDYLGRPVSGSITAHISVGFEYDPVYQGASKYFAQAFAQPGIYSTGVTARQSAITSWRHYDLVLRKGMCHMAEGWTLSDHHHLNPTETSTLYKGDGTINMNNTSIIDTVAGNGNPHYHGDGGPATEATVYWPRRVVVDASGNIYVGDYGNHRIRKVDTNGIITTVAGNGWSGYSGDGGPATEALFEDLTAFSLDASGNIYIADYGNHCIRMVDTNGIVTTIAGNGNQGYSGDGGPATEATFYNPKGVLVDVWGNIYIADSRNKRIRKIGTNGVIETIAGNGNQGYSGDGGPATEAMIYLPSNMAMDTSGNLYFADYYRIRKVDTNGIITTVAGNGDYDYGGDGGPAIEASFRQITDLAIDTSGSLYIADSWNHRIRKVDTNGIIQTVAGQKYLTAGIGDGGPATEAMFNWVWSVAVDASNDLYIADSQHKRIRKVASPLPQLAIGMSTGDIAFTEENGIGHIMSSAGRHKRTVDLDTGVTLYEFGCDEDNNLISITDHFGNQTIVDRDASGVPTAITSPDGLTTTLAIDASNHLTRITYLDGSSYSFEYTTDGLMTAKIEPEGNRFDHQFDSLGRLTDATDEERGNWQYSRTAYENGDILTEVLTGEGNLTSYLDHTFSTGAYTSTITDPTGAEIFFTQSADELTVNKSLPCGMELEFKYDVDPEYKFKYVKEMTESTPSSLENVTLREKTYQDTDSDYIPDLITETVTVNDSTTTLVHDTLQSQKTITSPEGRTVTTLYDPDTLLTTNLTIPDLYDTTYGYDVRGRLRSISTNTRETTFTYNAQGFLESITDPENYFTTYTYDSVGRMTGINRADGTSIGFTYDQNGNMTALTNPSMTDHEFSFNKVNLNDSYQAPISGSYSYVYDRDRRLIQTNFPSGNQINNIYDTTRLMQIQTPEGNIDFTYLCGTKVESITKGVDTITYGYDGKLITSETLSGTLNQTLGYTYNNDFNISSFSYAGNTHIYTYDDDGLLTGAGGFTIFRNTQNGLPEEVTGGTLNLSRTFNAYGEVEGQGFTINALSLTSWNLARDDNGRITDKAETVDGVTSSYTYTYDPMGRLLTVTKDGTVIEEYEYSPNGTRTYEMNELRGISGRSFAYSDEDHLLTAGDTTYEYDLDGFLTTKTFEAEVTQYDYSTRGELLSVTLPDGTAIDYLHDPLGRRIAKKVDGLIVEKYLWQGLTRLLAVYDGSDNLLMRFEYADGRMPVAMTKDGSTYYLTYDQVGSLRVVADASGNVIKRIDYDSFGNIIEDTSPAFMVPFGFAGGLHDRDTNLVRFGFRDYDPDIGRWTAKDPLLYTGNDTDLYGYCLNNPVIFIDPLGFFNIVVSDPGGRNGPIYGATITITSNNGRTVTAFGSSWPNPTNPNPGVAQGTYEAIYSPIGHRGREPGVRLENGGPVPTLVPNPLQNNQSFATGINIHSGYSATCRGSAGCITINPDQANQVWEILEPGETGNVTIIRDTSPCQ